MKGAVLGEGREGRVGGQETEVLLTGAAARLLVGTSSMFVLAGPARPLPGVDRHAPASVPRE